MLGRFVHCKGMLQTYQHEVFDQSLCAMCQSDPEQLAEVAAGHTRGQYNTHMETRMLMVRSSKAGQSAQLW